MKKYLIHSYHNNQKYCCDDHSNRCNDEKYILVRRIPRCDILR